MAIKLKYCGRDFELDIDGLCRWLDAKDRDRHSTAGLDGSYGHPSDAGWNAPTFSEYFLGMSDEAIEQYITDKFFDGSVIGDTAIPKIKKSGRIRSILEPRGRRAKGPMEIDDVQEPNTK